MVAALRRAVDVQDQVQARWTARNPGLSQAELLRRWWRWINSSSANLAMVRLGIEAAALDATATGLAGTGASRSDRAVAIEHRATPDRRGSSGGRRRRRGVAREGDVHRPRRRPPRDRRAPPAHPRPRGRPRPARPGRVGERGPVRPGHPGRLATATVDPASREVPRPRRRTPEQGQAAARTVLRPCRSWAPNTTRLRVAT